MPYLRVANVQDGHFDLSEIKEIDVPADKVKRYGIKKNDVLLTEGGDFDKLGRGAIWMGQITPCVHQNHVFAVRTNGNFLDTNFFAYVTSGPRGRAYFQSCAKQSTNLASINSTQLKQLPIPLPPLPEQKKIATILGTWDRANKKLQALIQAKTDRQRGLMQLLLTGKKRLPGFQGEWKSCKFGDFLTESRIPGSDGFSAQKITVKLYGRGVFPKSEVRTGSKNTKYYTRKAGQFIYSKLDFLNGAFAILPERLDGYESTLDLPAFDINIDADPRWLLAYIGRPHFYSKQVGAAAGGRKARRVNPGEFLALNLKAPPIEEQTAIAGLLDSASKELSLLSEQIKTLREQKRGLMQHLLTGKVRTVT